MKTKYNISLSDLKLIPDGLVVSDHFVKRWNERVNSNWERFCYFLHNLTVMCKDSDKRKHCLYYEPSCDEWYVFLIGKNRMLVTILTEDIYSRQINAAMLSPNKEIYLNKAFSEKTLLPMGQTFHVIVQYSQGYSVGCSTTYKCKWNKIFPKHNCLDAFFIRNNFETFCETLVTNELFLHWISTQVNTKKAEKIKLVICDIEQEIEVST